MTHLGFDVPGDALADSSEDEEETAEVAAFAAASSQSEPETNYNDPSGFFRLFTDPQAAEDCATGDIYDSDTSHDALLVIRRLSDSSWCGSHGQMLDVNGDQLLTASDALAVIRYLNAAGQLSEQSAEDAIREAAFRKLFERVGGMTAATGETVPPFSEVRFYFLSVEDESGDADPAADLIDRFDSAPVTVLPQSEATVSYIVRHGETGEQGILFSLEREIRHLDEDTAEVRGEYFLGGLHAEGLVFQLQREAESWTVVSETVWWVA